MVILSGAKDLSSSSPVIRGRIREGESHADDLAMKRSHDLKLATPDQSLAPSCILPRMTGEEDESR
jgi:hypothetical protein